MPELPETETIRRGLEEYVVGHRIENIEILHPGPFQGKVEDVQGATFIKARRIGKGIILDLDNGNSIAIHIKLTGQLIFRDSKTRKIPVSKDKVRSVPNAFTHVIFHLDRYAVLYYNDARRFGWLKVIPTEKIMELPLFKKMGPEPFKDLTKERFVEILSGSGTAIKPFIMDQSKIGGVGNIYANDALFKAGIDPRRPARSLTLKEAGALFDSLISVMEKSFEEGGASELSFVNVLGQEGNYQRHSLVYGKKGKPCLKCRGIIQRISLGGRGTFLCENCQR